MCVEPTLYVAALDVAHLLEMTTCKLLEVSRPAFGCKLPDGLRIAIVSRCSWTLYNFRRRLLHSVVEAGGVATALGACDDGFDGRLRADDIDVQHIPVSKAGVDPFADLRLLLVLVRRFRALRPDVVHSFTIKPSIFATLAAAMSGVPVCVVTITGLGYAFTSAGSLVRAIASFLYRLALARADRVFFQNVDDRDLFVRRGLVIERNARLIAGSGIDLEWYRPAPLPSQSGVPVRFLMIARLLNEKGVREYMSAAENLNARHPHVRFGLVGGADARNPSSLSPAEVATLQNSQSIDWVDEVDDVRPHIALADVIVLPSYREGLPRSLLEAGAMGRALIATDVPGCREVVRDQWNGYLVAPANAEALAQAMEKFIAQPDRIADFGARSRSLVSERFDERGVIDQTLAAYAELYELKVGSQLRSTA